MIKYDAIWAMQCLLSNSAANSAAIPLPTVCQNTDQVTDNMRFSTQNGRFPHAETAFFPCPQRNLSREITDEGIAHSLADPGPAARGPAREHSRRPERGPADRNPSSRHRRWDRGDRGDLLWGCD